MTPQSTEAMPPLPQHGELSPTDCSPLFSTDQMHAYAKAYAAPLLARVERLETLLFVWSDEQALESPENRKLFRAAVSAALAAHKEQP